MKVLKPSNLEHQKVNLNLAAKLFNVCLEGASKYYADMSPQKFHPDAAARTAKFVHMVRRYFEIFNISSFKQGPLTSMSCPKLTELHMILDYFETEVFSLGLLTDQTTSASVGHQCII